jgi:S-adenosylmethionine-dependent methyltransferase
MIDSVDDIAAFYDEDPQREDLRLEQHQLEHDLTWRYLDQYLPTQGSILEIGAATGRYSLELVRRGFSVTAVDLSPVLIRQAQERVASEKLEVEIRFVVADARDLNEVTEGDFDAVLMMGPLYHLVAEADRREALDQAFQRLRPGGLVFSSFLSRLGVLADLIRNAPTWIEDQSEVRSLVTRGKRPDDYSRGGFRGYFARVSEIAPLHEELGFETIAVAGVEPVISADDESFNRLQGSHRELWLDLLLEVSREKSILGASRHLLYVGKKPI